jgi:fructose-1,6-bisphosphatase/inositol monophosphatase family enzyme
MCEKLDFAHKRKIVHHDIKPTNVQLLRDGTVKLVDFGIARLEDSTMTQTGLILGTPSYMAPEVLTSGRVDFRADMWAVGVMLYELLAGQRPFEAPTIASLVYKIVHQPPPLLDAAALGLPAGIAAIVERALAKDPTGRFADLADMGSALQTAMGLTPTARAVSLEAREQSLRRDLEEARRALEADDLETALEAGRRAEALDPGRSEVMALLREIDARLETAPTVRRARSPAYEPAPRAAPPATVSAPSTQARPAARETSAGQAGPPTASATAGRRPTTSQVLTHLRARGAAVFREVATFGEPPATQTALISPRADVLAVSGADGAIRVWDLYARTRLQTLRTEMHQRAGHDAMALALAYSPDGSLLASGHIDGSVHVWDMERATELRVKLRHDAMVGALAFSVDGSVLATGGMDSTLKLWNVEAALSGEARREMCRQPAGVTALCYTADGEAIVTGHANRVMRLIDAASTRLLATLRGPESKITLLVPHPDGRLLAVASQDRTVRLFDVPKREQVLALPPHRKPASSLCFFPGGQHLATVALENAVHLWDLAAGDALAALWGRQDEVFSSLALFGGGEHLVVALADGRLRVWGPGE